MDIHENWKKLPKKLDPANVDAYRIVGGEDTGSGELTGLSLINDNGERQFYPRGTIISPGSTIDQRWGGEGRGVHRAGRLWLESHLSNGAIEPTLRVARYRIPGGPGKKAEVVELETDAQKAEFAEKPDKKKTPAAARALDPADKKDFPLLPKKGVAYAEVTSGLDEAKALAYESWALVPLTAAQTRALLMPEDFGKLPKSLSNGCVLVRLAGRAFLFNQEKQAEDFYNANLKFKKVA